MSGAIDLSQLPAPTVVETLDFEATLATRKAQLVALFPTDQQDAVNRVLSLYSEPLVMLLEESTYRENILRQRINEAAKAVMLAFASGADLDHLAANFNIERLTIQAADNTVTPPVPAVMETDDALRLRAQQAFEGLSVAGPTAAYEVFTRSADARVLDVTAVSPSPACVTITVLSNAGDGSAPDDLLAVIDAALSDEDVRPVADRVTVQSASITPYTIEAVLVLEDGPESEVILATAKNQLNDYITAQHRLGRGIYRNKIIGVLDATGISNIILTAPAADIELDKSQASYCTDIKLSTQRLPEPEGESE